MHEIDCVITGFNLGPGGQIWKSPRLPGTVMTAVRAMQLHIRVEHGFNGALEMKFLEDPSLIMSTISGEDNIKNMGETLLQTHENSRVNVDMTAKVSLPCGVPP